MSKFDNTNFKTFTRIGAKYAKQGKSKEELNKDMQQHGHVNSGYASRAHKEHEASHWQKKD